ncbi:uncharacterized protein LOC118204295 [Stegodyphus dumicola]|uniref:uncharacterized protein LOC118204295 n=1 Tax=Stegodyphus dumicola TaxID=202533 RepID=UPI0015B0FBD0|nr:uncharacterized protein LOC118204295 [Stegodyphus dumicola]
MDLEQQFENEPLNVDVPKISDSDCNSDPHHEKSKETPISRNTNGKRKIDEDNTSKKKRNGRFTEDTIPEELTHIGNNVFVGPTLFNGKITVHIRQYSKYGSSYYPTRNGVNLEPSCLDTFSQHSPQEVFTMNLRLPKNFSAEYDGYHITLKQLTVKRVEKSNIR